MGYIASMGDLSTAGMWAAGAAISFGIGEMFPVDNTKALLGTYSDNFANAMAHGVSGAVQNVWTGDRPGAGFASGFISAAFMPHPVKGEKVNPFKMVAAGVIGGAASTVAGGKFMNGFRTAAFIYLFNAHGSEDHKGVASEKAQKQSNDPYAFKGRTNTPKILKFAGDVIGFAALTVAFTPLTALALPLGFVSAAFHGGAGYLAADHTDVVFDGIQAGASEAITGLFEVKGRIPKAIVEAGVTATVEASK